MTEKIKYVHEVHGCNVRNRNNFYVDTFLTDSKSGSTMVRGLIVYNELPCEIINCDRSLNSGLFIIIFLSVTSIFLLIKSIIIMIIIMIRHIYDVDFESCLFFIQ